MKRKILTLLLASSLFGSGYGAEKILRMDGENLGYPSIYTSSAKGRGYALVSYIFDTLTWKDENGVVPMLATEWEVSPDNKTWIFKLNKNAKFTDGEKVTAEDVKFSFEYLKKYPYQWVSVAPVKDVKVLNEQTVAIELKEVYAPFITDIAGNVPILPKHIWEEVDNPAKFNSELAVIGSGPLKLKEYSKDTGTYIFDKNENYYLGEVVIDQLILSPVNNSKETLLSKEIDVASNMKYKDAMQLKQNPDYKVIEGPGFWVGRVYFNFDVPEFTQKEFRQALYYGINRDEIVKKALKNAAVAGNSGHIHPDSQWYKDSSNKYAFNPEKAKELLDELNMKDSDGDGIRESNGKNINLTLIAGEENLNMAEMIQFYLKNIGVNMNIKIMEGNTVGNLIREGKFEMAINGHGSFGGDPVLLKRFYNGESDGSTPFVTTQGGKQWNNQRFNELFREQIKEVDFQKRYETVGEMQEIISEELPTLTLYYKKIASAYNPKKLDGWFFTKDGVAIAIPTIQNKLIFIKGEWNEK
jgi:peptide/nickel transport system substrate-binding protein